MKPLHQGDVMRHKERLELVSVKEHGARPLRCRSYLSPLWLSWLYGWLVKLLRNLRCMSFPEPEARGGAGIPTPGGGSGMPPAMAPGRAGEVLAQCSLHFLEGKQQVGQESMKLFLS